MVQWIGTGSSTGMDLAVKIIPPVSTRTTKIDCDGLCTTMRDLNLPVAIARYTDIISLF